MSTTATCRLYDRHTSSGVVADLTQALAIAVEFQSKEVYVTKPNRSFKYSIDSAVMTRS